MDIIKINKDSTIEYGYTKAKFIDRVSKGGYACKKIATEWCEKNPKDFYYDQDIIECFRFSEERKPHESGKWRNWEGVKTTKRFKVTMK